MQMSIFFLTFVFRNNRDMEKVYLLFECDPWHTWDSMTPNSLVGVATTTEKVEELIKERLKTGWKDDLKFAVKDSGCENEEEFLDKIVEDFRNCRNQTQCLSDYFDFEFFAVETPTNLIVA